MRSKFPWTEITDVSRPDADVEIQDCLVWVEKEDGKCIFSVDGLDFRKYLQCELKEVFEKRDILVNTILKHEGKRKHKSLPSRPS